MVNSSTPLRNGLWQAASLITCLAAWQIASQFRLDFGLVTFRNLPAPREVLTAAWAMFHSPRMLSHIGASLFRVFGGFAVASAFGIAVGLAIGWSRLARNILFPPLEVMRPIPAVAWVPLAVLMFPSTELSMIFVTFTGALFPILLGTIHGVESVDPRLIAAGRSLGAGSGAILREIVLPGAAPGIVTGLAIGMGTSWFCLISAEMIAGQFGIGYYTWESYTLQNYADIVVGMLLIGMLGMGSTAILRRLGKALTPWQHSHGARG